MTDTTSTTIAGLQAQIQASLLAGHSAAAIAADAERRRDQEERDATAAAALTTAIEARLRDRLAGGSQDAERSSHGPRGY